MTRRYWLARLCTAASITLSLIGASPASAQRLPPLIGSAVRLEVDSGQRVAGRVTHQTADSLTLWGEHGALQYSVALAQVRHLERYAPHRSALLVGGGFLAGTVVGTVAGVFVAHEDKAHCERGPGEHDLCGLAGLDIPVCAVGGAVVGTIVGALAKVPYWEPVL